jgi:hypothetical protein
MDAPLCPAGPGQHHVLQQVADPLTDPDRRGGTKSGNSGFGKQWKEGRTNEPEVYEGGSLITLPPSPSFGNSIIGGDDRARPGQAGVLPRAIALQGSQAAF